MKITTDTNLLVRVAVRDHAGQAQAAAALLEQATLIVITLPCLCEFVWVLRKVYRFQTSDLSSAIRALLVVAKVEMNRPAVESGLAVLEAGGDFADGVIAYEGASLDGQTFVSFDKAAIAILKAQGYNTHLLS